MPSLMAVGTAAIHRATNLLFLHPQIPNLVPAALLGRHLYD